jgi:hypothetical protein
MESLPLPQPSTKKEKEDPIKTQCGVIITTKANPPLTPTISEIFTSDVASTKQQPKNVKDVATTTVSNCKSICDPSSPPYHVNNPYPSLNEIICVSSLPVDPLIAEHREAEKQIQQIRLQNHIITSLQQEVRSLTNQLGNSTNSNNHPTTTVFDLQQHQHLQLPYYNKTDGEFENQNVQQFSSYEPCISPASYIGQPYYCVESAETTIKPYTVIQQQSNPMYYGIYHYHLPNDDDMMTFNTDDNRYIGGQQQQPLDDMIHHPLGILSSFHHPTIDGGLCSINQQFNNSYTSYNYNTYECPMTAIHTAAS